jgi:hypothetical protein
MLSPQSPLCKPAPTIGYILSLCHTARATCIALLMQDRAKFLRCIVVGLTAVCIACRLIAAAPHLDWCAVLQLLTKGARRYGKADTYVDIFLPSLTFARPQHERHATGVLSHNAQQHFLRYGVLTADCQFGPHPLSQAAGWFAALVWKCTLSSPTATGLHAGSAARLLLRCPPVAPHSHRVVLNELDCDFTTSRNVHTGRLQIVASVAPIVWITATCLQGYWIVVAPGSSKRWRLERVQVCCRAADCASKSNALLWPYLVRSNFPPGYLLDIVRDTQLRSLLLLQGPISRTLPNNTTSYVG